MSPPFPNFTFCPFAFLKDQHEYLSSLTEVGFSLLQKERGVESENSIPRCLLGGAGGRRGEAVRSQQPQWRRPAPSPGARRGVAASSPTVGTLREHLCFISICLGPPFSKRCPKVPEKLRLGYFGVWKYSKMFSYKLMAIVSSLYAFSAYESFQRSTLLLDRGKSVFLQVMLTFMSLLRATF